MTSSLKTEKWPPKYGLMKLRDIASVLEACQFPSSFTEVRRRLGWFEHRTIRHLRFLMSLGLVETVVDEDGKKYVASKDGLKVLHRLNNVINDNVENQH